MHKEEIYTLNLNDFVLEKQKAVTETLQECVAYSALVLETHSATLKDGTE